jgi:predicted DNA-binding transcriptional regulator AlpA
MTDQRLLNIPDAARYLGISPRTLYNRCAARSKQPFPVAPIRIGRSVLFDIKDLDAFIESLKKGGE